MALCEPPDTVELDMDARRRVALLSRCPLFAGLTDADLQVLADAATVRHYRRGQIVFSEGDSGDSLLLVAEGRLKAYSMSPEGEEFLLHLVDAGESLGEVSVVDGRARSATVEAQTDSIVLRLPRTSVMSLAATSSALQQALLVALSSVVRRLTDAAADLVFLDLPRRVAKLVLDEYRAADSFVVDMALTQSEIASRVGASRQSVNAALRDFQRRGWILTSGHGRTLRILDVRALERFVDA